MSEHDETGNVRVVSVDTGEAEAKLAAVAETVAALDGKTAVERAGGHVITLKGADGFELVHPVQCTESLDCPVGEAAGRISRAMCETLGQWTCDVAGGSLMLVERIGDA